MEEKMANEMENMDHVGVYIGGYIGAIYGECKRKRSKTWTGYISISLA